MKPRCSVPVRNLAIVGTTIARKTAIMGTMMATNTTMEATMSARNTAWDVPDRHEMAVRAEVKKLGLKVKLLPSSRAARRARAWRLAKRIGRRSPSS